MAKLPPLTGMITEICWASLRSLLSQTSKIPGDVVELGCCAGRTSVRIALMIRNQNRILHVFDSFQGLPDAGEHDSLSVKKGACRATKKDLIRNFQQADLPLPIIHEGWFEQTLSAGLPQRISFAFLDSDRYESILLSLNSVLPRLSPGGVMVIHDYTDPKRFPGVRKACESVLGPLPAYPGGVGVWCAR